MAREPAALESNLLLGGLQGQRALHAPNLDQRCGLEHSTTERGQVGLESVEKKGLVALDGVTLATVASELSGALLLFVSGSPFGIQS